MTRKNQSQTADAHTIGLYEESPSPHSPPVHMTNATTAEQPQPATPVSSKEPDKPRGVTQHEVPSDLTADGWMFESLIDEERSPYIKIQGEALPIGYQRMNCSDADQPLHRQLILKLVSDWEICGFGNSGKVSGPRDEVQANIDCKSIDAGYGCFIAQRSAQEVDPYVNPNMNGMTWVARDSSTHYLNLTSSAWDEAKFLRAYIASSDYKLLLDKIKADNKSGILILGGSARLNTNALVSVKSIRHGAYPSNISIELHWQSSDQMDSDSWNVIQKAFSPIEGVDITRKWREIQPKQLGVLNDFLLTGFGAKIVSLLVTSFQHTLLMEATQMLLAPPSALFINPQYITYGNLFWPSLSKVNVPNCVYTENGLTPREARQALDAGKGFDSYDTFGAQIMINRGLHLDVILYALVSCVSSYDSCPLYDRIKPNLFPLAFARTAKAHLFSQVAVPPGGVWKRQEETNQSESHWRLAGLLQHDSYARPTFISCNFSIGIEADPIELISAPISQAWSEHYLYSNGSDTMSFEAPNDAFVIMKASDTPIFVRGEKEMFTRHPLPFTNSSQGCPLQTFLSLFEMKRQGLCIDGLSKEMVRECSPIMLKLLGQKEFGRFEREGLISMPNLQILNLSQRASNGSTAKETRLEGTIPKLAAFRPHHHTRLDHLQPQDSFSFTGPFIQGLRQVYKSHTWLRKNAKHISSLINKSRSNQ